MGISTWKWDSGEPVLPYLPVVTLPARGDWRCLVTCEELFTPHTHWLLGRTLPCMGDDCGACVNELPRRPEAFCSVITAHNRKHQIVRLTREVASTLLRGVSDARPLRGTMFSLKRRGDRENGHVTATVEEAAFETCRLPSPPVLTLHLCRVWRLDGLSVNDDHKLYVAQVADFVRSVERRCDDEQAA